MTNLRERKRVATRTAIIDAARQLFEKEGFDETSVDDIAAAALISKFTFYNFFESKDELLTQLHLEILHSLAQDVTELEVQATTVTEIIMSQVRHMAGWSEQNQGLARVFIERSRLIFPSDKADNCLLQFAGLIKSGQESGEFRRDFKAEDVARYVFVLAHGEKRNWVDSDCSYSLEEKFLDAAKFVLSALKP